MNSMKDVDNCAQPRKLVWQSYPHFSHYSQAQQQNFFFFLIEKGKTKPDNWRAT